MFAEVTLKLSILEPDPPPERGGLLKPPPEGGLLKLRQGDLAGRSYRVSLEACHRPTCPCCNIFAQCQLVLPDGHSSDPDPSQEFWLDVWNRKVAKTPELERDAKSLRLANAIQAELTNEDWEQLYHWFRVSKLEVIQTKPLGRVKTAKLPDASGGRMIGFVDIFPWGRALDFVLENEFWTVDERYCVQTGCTCKEALLTFARYEDSSARKIVKQTDSPYLRYDYRTGTAREDGPWPRTAPAPERLMAELKSAVPSLNRQLQLRHTMLQSLYLRRSLSHTKAEFKSVLSRAMAGLSNKIGQNELCPCGSGRKFKQCCGRTGA